MPIQGPRVDCIHIGKVDDDAGKRNQEDADTYELQPGFFLEIKVLPDEIHAYMGVPNVAET